jgi:hypothetical protein
MEKLKLYRSYKCRLCGARRIAKKVGKPGNPDYLVMVCVNCDLPLPSVRSK